MTEVDLDQWLRQCAGNIEFPLKRLRMKKRSHDVTLAVEVYRTRSGSGFYIEFAIYSDVMPRPGPHESKFVPIYDWRLKNPRLRKPDGWCPDLPLLDDDASRLGFAREQVVIQGKEIFAAAHSLRSLMETLRRQSSRIGSASDTQLADRIEAFLVRSESQ
jgi:hypothetical protein